MVIILSAKMWYGYSVVILWKFGINITMVVILTLVTWHKFNDGNYSNFGNLA